MKDVQVFPCRDTTENGEVVSSGGRVLSVTALGDTIAAAQDLAYAAVGKIQFEAATSGATLLLSRLRLTSRRPMVRLVLALA
jgi:phosphoribosylamine-glycine ligase